MTQEKDSLFAKSNGIDIAQAIARHNRRIIRLSLANIGMLVIWYVLSEEHRSPLTVEGVADFDVVYQALILALVALTIGLWVSLARVFWQRLGMPTSTQSSTKDN